MLTDDSYDHGPQLTPWDLITIALLAMLVWVPVILALWLVLS